MFVRHLPLFTAIGTFTLLAVWSAGEAAQSEKLPGTLRAPREVTTWTTAVDPKSLSDQTRRGLNWLVAHQHDSGGWGQGEESANMGQGMANLASRPNVADTCIATLALVRSGSTPSQGEYRKSILNGVDYVLSEIEQSDTESLSISSIKGTRVQGKLGPYIDTFLASVTLSEVKGKMPDAESEQRLVQGLEKVLDKIARNQQDDGTWGNEGWAPVLAQSMASKGLNRAKQAGLVVDDETIARSEENSRNQVDGPGGGLAAPGAAGVALYAGASNLSTLQDTVNSDLQREDDLKNKAENGGTDEERENAKLELERIAETRAACNTIQASIIERLDNQQFMAGFGSNGGEEFLSYMNIGESMVVKGGNDWLRWDEGITDNLNRIQNNDGSWSGHHCITGRTFCTATALLTLMVDRTPVPVEALTKADDS